MSLQQQQELESQYVMPTFGRKHVELVKGSGMHVFDDEGNPYLDFISGIGVVSLGHCHPLLVEALKEQTEKLMHVGNYYYIENRGEVSAMISGLLATGSQEADGNQAWQSFYANSGAEANECAIKLARLAAKKRGSSADIIVTLNKSFHGRTLATLAATAQPAKQEVFQPLPGGFVHTPINDIEALEALFEQLGDSVCAMMIECVQGESGVHPCTPEFIEAAEKLTHEKEALLICDEIQTGIYRCGEQPFAYQGYGISPDIVTIAKGVASGFPVGICAAKNEFAQVYQPGDHGSTFGGGPLAITAIKTTLETLESLNVGAQVEELGVYFRECLASLPFVTEVRGRGLMCACDVNEEYSAPELVDVALEKGMLINATGPHTLRFLPPLICTKLDIDELILRLSSLLD
ncbi:MAG: acetylornithine/succinylornithine family transaminase [Raoultibacter sp.]|jgi:acetylornithine/N-succinyldiaminopimelate aminotransferase